MATTLTLQNTITWATTILHNQPLLVNNQEPSLTCGNIVLQRILGSPFRWRFNRKALTIPISSAAGTDYQVSVPDLGRMEKMWLKDSSANINALTGEVELAAVSAPGRPTVIAPVYDDNQGNITFRFNFKPNANYTAYIDYQAKAALIAAPSSPWGVVPDEFSYIYDLGFLSFSSYLVGDARFPIWEQYFISSLLGAQDGLDEQAVSIFLGDRKSVV